LILSDVQRFLNGCQRCRDDLHVQDRHEHADAHHGEANPHRGGDGIGRVIFSRGGHWPLDTSPSLSAQTATERGLGPLRCPNLGQSDGG